MAQYSLLDEKKLVSTVFDPEIADDPLAFVKFIFPWGKPGPLQNFSGPRAWQQDVLLAVKEHIQKQKQNRINKKPYEVFQMAISAGRGIGKSALEVFLAYWMISTRPGASVLVSANSEEQLKKTTWGELAIWHGLALNSHWFELQATTLSPSKWFAEEIQRDLKIGGPYFQIQQKLWNEDNPSGYVGPHSQNGMMVLFDEASGIPESIWGAADGFFTDPIPDRYRFAFSNPRDNTSAFYKCFNEHRDFWLTREIDARTVEGTDKQVYEKIIRQYGADSDHARVEVYGQFPMQGEQQFISRSVVTAAMERELQPDEWAPLIMGVDPARFGDDTTVIRFRQGRNGRVLPPVKLKGADNMAVANECAHLIQKYNPDAVCIDAGNGTGIIDRLRELKFKVNEVWFGSKSSEPEWADKRTEIWAKMRDWLGGGCIDDDKFLISDLTGPKYKFNGDKIRLEAKEEMKKRGQHSPDDGDALACTFAVNVARRDNKLARGHGRKTRADVDYKIFS